MISAHPSLLVMHISFKCVVQSVVPARFRHDKQLVSHDTHSASYNYKYTFSVEIAPICKEDLVCLPPKVAQQHGQIGPLVLCMKVCLRLTRRIS
jgi:nonsense-mediated mRNA decay protein 3